MIQCFYFKKKCFYDKIQIEHKGICAQGLSQVLTVRCKSIVIVPDFMVGEPLVIKYEKSKDQWSQQQCDL